MRQKLSVAILVVLLALGFVPLKGWVFPTEARSAQSMQLVGLRAPVRVIRDSNYIPHIYGESEHDVFFMQGYLHAQDRLFQMDSFRRLVSGTLAELVGQSALSSDVQSRTLGLRRAAEASATEYPPESLAMMQAYADGVNAWLMDSNTQLPPEYGALEISKSGVPEWTPVDCIVMAKGLAFQLSQSISEEIALSLKLSGYQNAGEDGGFDGTALFFEDTFRSAPFDPTVSIPGFMPGASLSAAGKHRNPMVEASRNLQKVMTPEVRQLLQNYLDTIKTSSHLSAFMDRRAAEIGSNWWVIGGSNTDTGHPMLASDPHLSLSTPPIWYEAHLVVSDDPDFGPMNVNGVTLPGTPGVVLGSNEHICWAATVDPMDVTDVYLEELRPSPNSPVPGFTVFDGEEEPIVVIPQQFRVNLVGDGMPDNLVPANVPPDQGGLAFIVPRRNNGPIVQVLFGTLGLSVQYTGWGATRELDTFRTWWRARNIDDFKRGLQNFDFGNQNWSYADVDGNIAYFTDVEVPVREDLQAGTISGVPPFLIRDGTHTNLNEWLPVQNPQPGQALDYEILPFDELPHVVNPSQGYIANANQDPIGTTVDNNPLNQLRPGGGIYYPTFR